MSAVNEAHGEVCKTDPCGECQIMTRIGKGLAAKAFAARKGARVELHVSRGELEAWLEVAAQLAADVMRDRQRLERVRMAGESKDGRQ